jgi:galactokinase
MPTAQPSYSTKMETFQAVTTEFMRRFHHRAAFVVRAPGRVNLIGEHTDYNDGFVLPMAIDRAIWIALRPRADRQVQVYSLDFEELAGFSLDDLEKGMGWSEYIKGVAHELKAAGYAVEGWDGVLGGDVPKGAGLSSSAALELAAARAFSAVSGFAWEPARMAQIGQKAENRWVGVNCGIMDQMVSAAAQAGHALFLDCRSLEYENVPLPEGAAVVVMDSSTRRGLVDSAYNERRAQCEEAARFFGVPALRDVSLERFEEETEKRKEERGKRGGERGKRKEERGREERGEIVDEVTMRRARHIVTENQRVLDAVAAMRAGDLDRLGILFNESHTSLRDDFEVTNEALNQIVEAAQSHPACFGARMTGGGFGGCAVALVEAGKAGDFVEAVEAGYRQRSGLEAQMYVCEASERASTIYDF